jgi:hypothetical protein
MPALAVGLGGGAVGPTDVSSGEVVVGWQGRVVVLAASIAVRVADQPGVGGGGRVGGWRWLGGRVLRAGVGPGGGAGGLWPNRSGGPAGSNGGSQHRSSAGAGGGVGGPGGGS